MASVQDVIEKFNAADGSIRATFPKVDPRLVVGLVFDRYANQQNIYTLDVILKPGQDTEAIRQAVMNKTGMSPGFYLNGTKMIVSHMLDLEFLKWINDQDGIVSIKGSRHGAGGSTDF
jgi:hypothetical protein